MKKRRRSDLGRSLGQLVVGALFVAVSVPLGGEAGWNPLYVFRGSRGDMVAWLLVGGGLLIGIGAMVLGGVSLVAELRCRLGARR